MYAYIFKFTNLSVILPNLCFSELRLRICSTRAPTHPRYSKEFLAVYAVKYVVYMALVMLCDFRAASGIQVSVHIIAHQNAELWLKLITKLALLLCGDHNGYYTS